MQTLDDLNELYANHSIKFLEGEGGLLKCEIQHPNAAAEFYLNGGHVTHFQPSGKEPVLWMSRVSNFELGKPIRGGIPICWPWFGAADDPSLPQHGFARNSIWEVITTRQTTESAFVDLKLESSPKTKSIWPHSFELELSLQFGKELVVELTTKNTGDKSFKLGTAIHSYFNIGNVAEIELSGLDQVKYIDQLENNSTRQQTGLITIGEEVDRVYIDSEQQVSISDKVMNRSIHVSKTGSQSTVVWNPWIAKSQRMVDFPDDGYKTMVCVETANAFTDFREISANQSHTITQRIVVE